MPNRLSKSDPLYSDQEINVPLPSPGSGVQNISLSEISSKSPIKTDKLITPTSIHNGSPFFNSLPAVSPMPVNPFEAQIPISQFTTVQKEDLPIETEIKGPKATNGPIDYSDSDSDEIELNFG